MVSEGLFYKPGTVYMIPDPAIEIERELSSKIHEDARRSLNSWNFNSAIQKFRIVEPEDKVVARNNLQSCFASEITRNPAYLVEEIDYNIARTNPNTLFAGGIVQNPGYKPQSLDNLVARNNFCSEFAAYLPKNDWFVPEEEDVLWNQQGNNRTSFYGGALPNNLLYRLLLNQMYDQGKIEKLELSGRTPSLGEVVETAAGVLRAVNTAKAVAQGIKGIIKP